MEHVVSIFYSLLDKPNKKVIKKRQIQNLHYYFSYNFLWFLQNDLKGTNYMLCKHLGHIITLYVWLITLITSRQFI